MARDGSDREQHNPCEVNFPQPEYLAKGPKRQQQHDDGDLINVDTWIAAVASVCRSAPITGSTRLTATPSRIAIASQIGTSDQRRRGNGNPSSGEP